MSAYAQRLIANGEDNKSIIILLETEYPELLQKVGEGWVQSLRK